jgi:hypothetical protein
MDLRSPLRLSVLVTLVSLGFAAVVGLIAVFDAGSAPGGIGRGLGSALTIFAAGATVSVALACLKRGRLEWASFAAVVAAGVAIDLSVLALWQQIENEAYGKVAGVAFVWTFFALIALGLTLAVGRPSHAAYSLYLGALAAAVLAGVVATWLVATAGNVFNGPSEIIGNDDLLRVLGAALVMLAALWFGALSLSRVDGRIDGEAGDGTSGAA